MGHTRAPRSVGIIVDGNRRWAKSRNLPVTEWHVEGAANIKRVIRYARDAGVETLYFYVFSTENWSRAKAEVSALLGLLESWLERELQEVIEEGARVRFLGERSRFSKKMQALMQRMEDTSKANKGGTVAFCLSYGGRAEIVEAVNALLKSGVREANEAEFSRHLWSEGLPDPDLIIRTGGARRLSNFLTWQSVYSELFFTDTLWPEFGEAEFGRILKEYGDRERRWGT